MATKLRNRATGHTVTTDNPETISNLRFGSGYEIVPTPAKPDDQPAEPTPPAEPVEEPAPAAAALRPAAERKRS